MRRGSQSGRSLWIGARPPECCADGCRNGRGEEQAIYMRSANCEVRSNPAAQAKRTKRPPVVWKAKTPTGFHISAQRLRRSAVLRRYPGSMCRKVKATLKAVASCYNEPQTPVIGRAIKDRVKQSVSFTTAAPSRTRRRAPYGLTRQRL